MTLSSFDAWSPTVIDHLYKILNIFALHHGIVFEYLIQSTKMPLLLLDFSVSSLCSFFARRRSVFTILKQHFLQ